MSLFFSVGDIYFLNTFKCPSQRVTPTIPPSDKPSSVSLSEINIASFFLFHTTPGKLIILHFEDGDLAPHKGPLTYSFAFCLNFIVASIETGYFQLYII